MELSEKDFAVLILFFEKLKLTKNCIRSFLHSKVNIYILNNNSSVESFEKLKVFCSSYPQIYIFNSDNNLGPAGGRNFLIRNTREPWLVFVDNDILVKSGKWFNVLKQNIIQYPDVQIFVPKLYNYHEKEFASFHSFKIVNESVSEEPVKNGMVNCFPGGASVVHRKIFEKNGLYDDRLYAFEDYEFAIRCLVRGNELKAFLINDIIFDHRHIYHKKKVDKLIVLQRYSNKRLTYAAKIIEETHHIYFDHYWKWWVDKQIYQMTKANYLRRIINYLRRSIKIN